jgi:glucose/arabinose dehydrogenase
MRHVSRVVTLAVSSLTASAFAQSVDDVWARNCAMCHGKTGRGGGAGTRTMLTAELFSQDKDRDFFDAIKNGRPDAAMPGFGATMDDARIWALVVHIRELQSRSLREKGGSPKAENDVFSSKYHRYRLQPVVVQGLDVPWAVDFLPDGRLLITDRPGPVRVFTPSKDGGRGELSQPLKGTPAVRNRGQGGMLEVAVHPEHSKNGWVYLAFSDPQGEAGRKGMTKLVRGEIENGEWVRERVIFEAAPDTYTGSDIHFGCKIAFAPPAADGRRYLYFCIGERGAGDRAQNLSLPNGKVHRVWDDGEVPTDNPFASDAEALKSVWSYGHRNPQGLTFDLDGVLWDTEHGPRGGDELNRIEPGKNYGWPLISFGINYNDSPYRTPWPSEGQDFVMPVLRWLPSIAVCGLDVARGPSFPQWKGDLLVGGLAGQVVERVRIKDGKFFEREELIHGLGRVRDVACGPDGSVYIVFNDPDQVMKLVPAD